jgi:hypothetical protein
MRANSKHRERDRSASDASGIGACRAKEKTRQHCRGARMSCSGEAFSIPGTERSTRRWQRSRD